MAGQQAPPQMLELRWLSPTASASPTCCLSLGFTRAWRALAWHQEQ